MLFRTEPSAAPGSDKYDAAFYTGSFQAFCTTLWPSGPLPEDFPISQIHDQTYPQLTSEEKAYPPSLSAACDAVKAKEGPAHIKDFVVDLAESLNLDASKCYDLLHYYLKYHVEGDFQATREDKKMLVEWIQAERVARINALMLMVKGKSSCVPPTGIESTVISLLNNKIQEIRKKLTPSDSEPVPRISDVHSLLSELVATLDLWFTHIQVFPTSEDAKCKALTDAVKHLSELSFLFEAFGPAGYATVRRIGCLTMLIVLAILELEKGSQRWAKVISGLSMSTSIDQVLLNIIPTLSQSPNRSCDTPEVDAAAHVPHLGPLYLAASSLVSSQEQGQEDGRKVMAANHAVRMQAFAYLSTVVDTDSPFYLWSEFCPNVNLYENIIQALMTTLATSWNWTAVSLSTVKQSVAVLDQLASRSQSNTAQSQESWSALSDHLALLFPTLPATASYLQLLASFCKSSKSIADVVGKLRCVQFFALRLPEDQYKQLPGSHGQLPGPLCSDNVVVPALSKYVVVAHPNDEETSSLVCTRKDVHTLGFLLMKMAQVTTMDLEASSTARQDSPVSLVRATLNLFHAILSHNEEDEAEMNAGCGEAFLEELCTVAQKVYPPGLIALLGTLVHRIGEWRCHVRDTPLKVDTVHLLWKCMCVIAKMQDPGTKLRHDVLLWVVRACNSGLAMDFIVRPRGEASLKHYPATLQLLELIYTLTEENHDVYMLQWVVKIFNSNLEWAYNRLHHRWMISQWCLRILVSAAVDGHLSSIPAYLIEVHHRNHIPEGNAIEGLLQGIAADTKLYKVLFTVLGQGYHILHHTHNVHQPSTMAAIHSCVCMGLHLIEIILHGFLQSRSSGSASEPHAAAGCSTQFEAALMDWMVSASPSHHQQQPLIAIIFSLMDYRPIGRQKPDDIRLAATSVIGLVPRIRMSFSGESRVPSLLVYLRDKYNNNVAKEMVDRCLTRLNRKDSDLRLRKALLMLVYSLVDTNSPLGPYFIEPPTDLFKILSTVTPSDAPASDNPTTLDCILSIIQNESDPPLELVAASLEVLLRCWPVAEYQPSVLKAIARHSKPDASVWSCLMSLINRVVSLDDQVGLQGPTLEEAAWTWSCAASSMSLFALECHRRVSLNVDADPDEDGKIFRQQLTELAKKLPELLHLALDPPRGMDSDGKPCMAEMIQEATSLFFQEVLNCGLAVQGQSIMNALNPLRNSEKRSLVQWGDNYVYNKYMLEAVDDRLADQGSELNLILSVVEGKTSFVRAFYTLLAVVLQEGPDVDKPSPIPSSKQGYIPFGVKQLNELISITLEQCLLLSAVRPGGGVEEKEVCLLAHKHDVAQRESCSVMLMELVDACKRRITSKDEASDTLASFSTPTLASLQVLCSESISPRAQKNLLVALLSLLSYDRDVLKAPDNQRLEGSFENTFSSPIYCDLYTMLPVYIADPNSECYNAALSLLASFGTALPSRGGTNMATAAILQALSSSLVRCFEEAQLAAEHTSEGGVPTSEMPGDSGESKGALTLLQLLALLRIGSSLEGIQVIHQVGVVQALSNIQPNQLLSLCPSNPDTTRSSCRVGDALTQRHWHRVWCSVLTCIGQFLVTLIQCQPPAARTSGVPAEVAPFVESLGAFVQSHASTFSAVLEGASIAKLGFTIYDLQECHLCLNIMYSFCVLNRPLLALIPSAKTGLVVCSNLFSRHTSSSSAPKLPFSSLGGFDRSASPSRSRSRSASAQRESSSASDLNRPQLDLEEELFRFRLLKGYLSIFRLVTSQSLIGHMGKGVASWSLALDAPSPPQPTPDILVLDLISEGTFYRRTHHWSNVTSTLTTQTMQGVAPLSVCIQLMKFGENRLKRIFPAPKAHRSPSAMKPLGLTPSPNSRSESVCDPSPNSDVLSEVLQVLREAAHVLVLHVWLIQQIPSHLFSPEQIAAETELKPLLPALVKELSDQLKRVDDHIEHSGHLIPHVSEVKEFLHIIHNHIGTL